MAYNQFKYSQIDSTNFNSVPKDIEVLKELFDKMRVEVNGEVKKHLPKDIAVKYLDNSPCNEHFRIYNGLDIAYVVKNRNNKIIAFATVSIPEKNTAIIRKLFVSKQYRNRKIARSLMSIILCQFKDKSIELTVANYNTAAIQFYVKMGFNPLCTRMFI